MADPAGSGKQVIDFELGVGDPVTQGSHRSELEFGNKKLQYGQTYWFAFREYIYDWGTLPSGDEQLFGFQFHNGNTDAGFSPSVALTAYGAKGGGRSFQVFVSYSTSTTPNLSNYQAWWSPNIAIPFGRWIDFVVKVKADIGGAGVAQVWMDGTQIANYAGPVGYYTPGIADYAKFGYYNWSPYTTNRRVMMRSPVVVADPTGSKYSPADLRTFINQ
jgi:hypothetical protein